MPAKPPKMPKNPTQEQLDDYSKTLEQYFKDKEKGNWLSNNGNQTEPLQN